MATRSECIIDRTENMGEASMAAALQALEA